MNVFSLHLLAAERSESCADVLRFVGADASGSFGLLAHHERFITVLVFGLARLQHGDGQWEYLGIPGGVLYFADNVCRISTRRYLRDRDVGAIARQLGSELLAEEQALAAQRSRLHHIENGLFRQLAELERNQEA